MYVALGSLDIGYVSEFIQQPNRDTHPTASLHLYNSHLSGTSTILAHLNNFGEAVFS